jgi:hypothetical protein
MEPNYDDTLAGAFLKWRNGKVKIWDYSPTHFRFTLRVESREIPGNLHIVCGDCFYVCGPFKWHNCDLEMRRMESGDREKFMVLKDKTSGFELHCAVVSVEENVAPVYSANLGICETVAGQR